MLIWVEQNGFPKYGFSGWLDGLFLPSLRRFKAELPTPLRNGAAVILSSTTIYAIASNGSVWSAPRPAPVHLQRRLVIAMRRSGPRHEESRPPGPSASGRGPRRSVGAFCVLAFYRKHDSQVALRISRVPLDVAAIDGLKVLVEIARLWLEGCPGGFAHRQAAENLTFGLRRLPANHDQPCRRIKRLLDHEREPPSTIGTADKQSPGFRVGATCGPRFISMRVGLPD